MAKAPVRSFTVLVVAAAAAASSAVWSGAGLEDGTLQAGSLEATRTLERRAHDVRWRSCVDAVPPVPSSGAEAPASDDSSCL